MLEACCTATSNPPTCFPISEEAITMWPNVSVLTKIKTCDKLIYQNIFGKTLFILVEIGIDELRLQPHRWLI